MTDWEKNRLLDEKEVAKLIGRAVQTLRNDRLARKGLPYIKIGRSVRYQWADVLAHIEARRIVPEAL
jgi:predicted DNA-binding transcriptional regulator AlpA